MPIDKSISDSMLDPFRNMLKDLIARAIKGKAFDAANATMQKMEKYAAEMDDMMEFSTKLAVEGLYTDFSNQYTKAIMSATQNQPADDASLLKQTHKSMCDAYNYHKDRKESKHLLPPIKRIVEIGESGVSYPVYLRMCEEEGLYDAMKSGQQRPVIEFEIDVAQKMYDPVRTEMFTKILSKWDEMAAKGFYKHPDSVEFEIERNRIEWEYAPKIAKWDATFRRWDKLFEMLFDWIDSFADFAPKDERWVGESDSITEKNIRRTQECYPGFFKVREAIFNEASGLAWNDIFSHQTYLNEVKAERIWYSDEVIQMFKEAYPFLKPGSKPSDEIISKTEKLHKENRFISEKYLKRWSKGDSYNFSDFSKFSEKYSQ